MTRENQIKNKSDARKTMADVLSLVPVSAFLYTRHPALFSQFSAAHHLISPKMTSVVLKHISLSNLGWNFEKSKVGRLVTSYVSLLILSVGQSKNGFPPEIHQDRIGN